jgi:hypothetical protein
VLECREAGEDGGDGEVDDGERGLLAQQLAQENGPRAKRRRARRQAASWMVENASSCTWRWPRPAA